MSYRIDFFIWHWSKIWKSANWKCSQSYRFFSCNVLPNPQCLGSNISISQWKKSMGRNTSEPLCPWWCHSSLTCYTDSTTAVITACKSKIKAASVLEKTMFLAETWLANYKQTCCVLWQSSLWRMPAVLQALQWSHLLRLERVTFSLSFCTP